MKKKNLLIFIMMFTVIFTSSVYCSTSGNIKNVQSGIDSKSTSSSKALSSADSHPGLIYTYDKDINYSIYSSQIIDTYLIACALHHDFQSQTLLPNTDDFEIYSKAKKYFLPYKDHAFIKNLDKYMFNDDINGDAIGILLSCSDSAELKPVYPFQQTYMSWTFNDKKNIDEFLSQLRSFYKDSKADEFFNQNSDQYKNVSDYIRKNIEKTNIVNIIKETEAYVGNKGKYYPKGKVSYQTMITIFRPSIASFYRITSDKGTSIISFQSPNEYSRNPEKLDIIITASNSIHEFLHSYLNIPVANSNSLIKELSASKDKVDYAHQMYQSMEWNRIVDENFVRAVQGRIYKKVFGEKRALNEIIEPQEKFAGFKKLRKVYEKLDEYDNNRKSYPSIDDFMPILIKELFK